MRPTRLAILITLVGVVAGCAASVETPAPSASSAPSPSAAASALPDPAAAELDRLLAALETTHPEPFHGIPRDEFVAALDDYRAALPGLTDDQAVVQMMRLVAMLSREGRDGHQFAFPTAGNEGSVLPLRIYEFEEGVYVTAAAAPNEAIVGSRIAAIAGTDIDEVLAAVEPLVPRDGPATVPAFRPVLMLRGQVLAGLGIIGDGPVEVALETPAGDLSTVTLELMPFDEYVAWAGAFGMLQLPADDRVAYLAAPEPLRVELFNDSSLYLRYRSVIRPDLDEVGALMAEGDVSRLILDLRQNPGGDNTTYAPLRTLVQEFAGDHPGGVTVLTDRVTFSAAANLATEIEGSTDATFVGEAMGGGLNFWDDVRWVTLDALPVPMQVGVSTRYWQFAAADDQRLTIEPDVPIAVTAADYFAGRDPVLDAALAAAG
jgi:hypothetical protein